MALANGNLQKELEAELGCPICREEFRRPKIAGPCGHTFCEDCLERYASETARGSYFHCPTCRQGCNFRTVRELATNFTVQKIIDRVDAARESARNTASRRCDACPAGRVAWANVVVEQACAACDGMVLCQHCALKHRKNPSTRQHELTGICDEHGKPLRFFCRNEICDGGLLCIVCREFCSELHEESVVPYREVVSEQSNDLRAVLRTARKESKIKLEEMEWQLSNLMKKERECLSESKQDIGTQVEKAVGQNNAKTKKLDGEIKRLQRRIDELRQDKRDLSNQSQRWQDWRDGIVRYLEADHEEVEDEMNVSIAEVNSLKFPLCKQIKHAEKLMAKKPLMPELKEDIQEAAEDLSTLTSDVTTDRLARHRERQALRKPDTEGIRELFRGLRVGAALDENDPERQNMVDTEIGLEYLAARGKGSCGVGYQDLKVRSSVKRVSSVLHMGKDRAVGCGLCHSGDYCVWVWNGSEPDVLITDQVPMTYLAKVGEDEVVVLRAENPILRRIDLGTKEIRDIKVDFGGAAVGSLWQVEVVGLEKYLVTYSTKEPDKLHHIAVVSDGAFVQDLEVPRRECLTFSRVLGLVITCSFYADNVSVYKFHPDHRGLQMVKFEVNLAQGFRCTDVCSGSLGEVFVTGTMDGREQWGRSEIRFYQLANLVREDDDDMDPMFHRRIEFQRLDTPGLDMKSASWSPKCSMGGRPANTLLVEYGNNVKMITLKSSSLDDHGFL